MNNQLSADLDKIKKFKVNFEFVNDLAFEDMVAYLENDGQEQDDFIISQIEMIDDIWLLSGNEFVDFYMDSSDYEKQKLEWIKYIFLHFLAIQVADTAITEFKLNYLSIQEISELVFHAILSNENLAVKLDLDWDIKKMRFVKEWFFDNLETDISNYLKSKKIGIHLSTAWELEVLFASPIAASYN